MKRRRPEGADPRKLPVISCGSAMAEDTCSGGRGGLPAPTRSSNDGVDGPLWHLGARMMVGETHHRREPSMGEVTTIGLDLAKHVFQVHGVDASGATVLRKQLRRSQVVAFFAG